MSLFSVALGTTTESAGVDQATSPLFVSSPLVTKPKMLNFAAYCSPNGTMPRPAEGFAYAVIDDRLYVFGGSDLNGQESDDLYEFTLKSGWQKVEAQNPDASQKPSARVASAMTSYKSKLYVFGGINEAHGWLNDFYEFDPETSTWKRLANEMINQGPSPRDKMALIAKRDKLYLYGGFGPKQTSASPTNGHSDAEGGSGCPKNGSGEGQSPVADKNGSSNGQKNGSEASSNANGSPHSDVEEKELKTAMKSAQGEQIGAEFGYFDDFYCFDPATGQWSPVEVDTTPSPSADGDSKSATPPGLAAYTVTAWADKLLYFGGKTSSGERTNKVYCFALGLKKWIPLHVRDDSRWPIGRSFHASAFINDDSRHMITFGGRDVEDWECDDIWLLDMGKMQWMLVRCEGVGGVSAPCARYGSALAILPDADSRQHVVIYGGSAELDPASGVAQDVLTDMYVVPADEIIQSCAPVFGDSEDDKLAKHQHHAFHFQKANTTGGSSGDDVEETSNDGPTAAKLPKCDDCIDI